MPRNHTVVFGSRDRVTSVVCASGRSMQPIGDGIWECTCCDCYLILEPTENAGEREVSRIQNCSKHKTAHVTARA